MTYVGEISPAKMTMNAHQELRFSLGKAVSFYAANATSRVDLEKGSDRLSFKAHIVLAHNMEMLPGNLFSFDETCSMSYRLQSDF